MNAHWVDLQVNGYAGARAFTHLGNGIPNRVDRHDQIVFAALLQERIGLTPDECRAIGRDNPLALIGEA